MAFPTYASGTVHTWAGNEADLANGHRTLSTITGGVETHRELIYAGEKTLTEATATIVANVTVAASKYIGGRIIATTHANDATDFQAITESLNFAAVNKAGTVTASIQATATTSTTATSSGTLSCVWTAVVNGNSVDLKCAATSSLTQTALKCSYQIILNGDGASVIT